MKLQALILLAGSEQASAISYSNLEPEVVQCSSTTATTGPHDFDYSLENICRTAETVETPTKLKINKGQVPEWMNFNWYRTGPGIFEFGDDEYQNLGDPLAMIQRMKFKNGEVEYQSHLLESVHFKMNEESNAIVTPEMGTWGEPEWVTNCELSDDGTNPCMLDWMTSADFVSDNAYVSFFVVGGRLFASGETYHIWELDPITGLGIRRINLNDLFPETIFKNNPETGCETVATHLAHSQYDPSTDELFMAMTCLSGHAMPKITYVAYKIPAAGSEIKRNPSESIEDIFSRAVILHEEIGKHNSMRSYEQDYYHDFAITENFYIFETISMKIDFLKMAEVMYNRQPLAMGAYYDDTQHGEFHIINRHTKEHKSFISPPNMAFHVLNAYEEDNTIVYDMTSSGNGNQFGTVWFANLTGTKEEMEDVFNHVAPVQYPSRYILDMDQPDGTLVTPTLMHKEGHLPRGGADFPSINKDKIFKQKYDYVWLNAFREVFNVDSVYKLEVSSGETICRNIKGYVPGEGRFVANPEGTNEDDGVLIHQWMPLTTDDKPLLTILNASDLSLIAELEFPMSFLPVGIHGMIFPEIRDEHSNPQCKSQSAADVCEQDCSSVEHKCIIDCEGDIDCVRNCSRDVSRCFDRCPCHSECVNGCPCSYQTDYCDMDLESEPPNDGEVICEDCEGGDGNSSFDKFNVFSSVLYLTISFLLTRN